MDRDCIQFVRKCHDCQIHGDQIHIPPSELHNLASPWPFSAWGIDIIGPIKPTASNGHKYIIVVIEYFSCYMEVVSLPNVTAQSMKEFIDKRLNCKFGLPHHIVSDNGVQFQGVTAEFLKEHKIEHHKSSPYRPQANGAVEAANKTVKKILAKMVKTYKDWSSQLPYAVMGYNTTVRSVTCQTPYSLVYGG